MYKKHLITPKGVFKMIIDGINNINFRENTLSREMNSADAILMLRDPNAMVRFKHSQEYARKADSVESNPIVALGYKLYRTFSLISNHKNQSAEHIEYKA